MKLGDQKSDYVWTSTAAVVTVVMNALLFHYLVPTVGELGFSEYVIGRRALSFITVVVFLGSGVALPRFLAMGSKSNQAPLGYLLGAFLLVAPGLLISSIALALFPDKISIYLFNESGHESLVASLMFFLWASAINALVYSFFRGLLRFREAAYLACATAAVLPVALILSSSATDLFLNTSWLTIVADVTFLIIYSSRTNHSWLQISQTAKAGIRPLATYGLPRVPGDIGLQALFLAPILYANFAYSISIGSFVAFALVFIGLANTALSPISFVLLPRATLILRDDGFSKANREILIILYGTLVLSALAAIAIFFASEFIIFKYLVITDERAVEVLKVVSISIVPYAVYTVLRSIIDAADERPLNAYNIYFSVGGFIFAALCSRLLFDNEFLPFIAAIPIGFFILGIRTGLTVRNLARADTRPQPPTFN